MILFKTIAVGPTATQKTTISEAQMERMRESVSLAFQKKSDTEQQTMAIDVITEELLEGPSESMASNKLNTAMATLRTLLHLELPGGETGLQLPPSHPHLRPESVSLQAGHRCFLGALGDGSPPIHTLARQSLARQEISKEFSLWIPFGVRHAMGKDKVRKEAGGSLEKSGHFLWALGGIWPFGVNATNLAKFRTTCHKSSFFIRT